MRTTKSVTISLPAEQLKVAERMAKKHNRTMSELFREGLRRLEQEEEWRPSPAALAQFGKIVRLIQEDARRAGLDGMKPAEIDAEVSAVRKQQVSKAKRSTKRSGK